jgi:hypothetical protein
VIEGSLNREVDYFLNKKPILDEYQIEEIEHHICYVMEYHLPTREIHINPITKELRIQRKDSSFEAYTV